MTEIPKPIFIEPIIPAGREKSYLRREGVLPFLEIRCNIFKTIYLIPSPHPSPLGRGDVEDGREEL